MKTITHSSPIRIATPISGFKKLNDYLVKPLKAGFLGFTTILMIIFFINLLSLITGANKQFTMDYLDMLLAGVGFLLQMIGSVLKNFIR